MVYTVNPNQSFFDVVLMSCGTLECAMAIASANGISVSDDLAVGQQLIIPDATTLSDAGLETDGLVLKYLQQNNIVIGTEAITWSPGGFIDEPGDNELLAEDGSRLISE